MFRQRWAFWYSCWISEARDLAKKIVHTEVNGASFVPAAEAERAVRFVVQSSELLLTRQDPDLALANLHGILRQGPWRRPCNHTAVLGGEEACVAGTDNLSLAVVVMHGAHEVSTLLRVGGVVAFLVMDEQAGVVIGRVVEELGCPHDQFVGIGNGNGVFASELEEAPKPGRLGPIGCACESEQGAADKSEELAPRGAVLRGLFDREGAGAGAGFRIAHSWK